MRTLSFVLSLLLITGCRDTEPIDDDADGVLVEDDCNDQDPLVHPEADELCNGIDDDCDGDIDENAIDGATYYADGGLRWLRRRGGEYPGLRGAGGLRRGRERLQ